jgi:hypothetical protein
METQSMDWKGTWSNQYGSTLHIDDDSRGELRGRFRTALEDSGFFGQQCPVLGMHLGDCLSFTFAAGTAKGDMICTFAGVLRDGRLQTVWHVVSDSAEGGTAKRAWPHAVMTNADVFERVRPAD